MLNPKYQLINIIQVNRTTRKSNIYDRTKQWQNQNRTQQKQLQVSWLCEQNGEGNGILSRQKKNWSLNFRQCVTLGQKM